ncbi:MAG: hypothetical protein ACLGI7_12545 [Gammaproteobacteria bacterium]
MSAVDAAILLVGFLTATLSGVAGLGGGTILIGVFYALGMAPAEAVPLFAAVQFVANGSRTIAYLPTSNGMPPAGSRSPRCRRRFWSHRSSKTSMSTSCGWCSPG